MASVATLTAGNVMDAIAALMNDVARERYTYVVQVPYLNMAIGELREYFALNDVPLVDKKSVEIALPAGQTFIGYDTTPPQAELPDDFIEPTEVWQKNSGTTGFTSVGRKVILEESLDGVESNALTGYIWANQKIQFQPATGALVIKLDYVAQVILNVVNETSPINILTAQSFLQYRTTALLAENVEENEDRANKNNIAAGISLDRLLGIGAKSGQGVITRRRPFRAGYRSR